MRLQAVERFKGGQRNREIAAVLRVSERSVERWRRQWREGGEAGVLSMGSPGRPRLSDTHIATLESELERGQLVHGWADQRWTLARSSPQSLRRSTKWGVSTSVAPSGDRAAARGVCGPSQVSAGHGASAKPLADHSEHC
ncbi:transposase [Streptomyces sp. NPDC012637]|uniref:helix-turn-helix domain-containing protein n=1 Tax=Streptomyces sp. NPDC012637 TaxID=3364842 RepID=UPI0036E151F4